MFQRGGLLLFSAILAVFFYGANNASACEGLIINEVQIIGSENKTKEDFVELYNPTDGLINLKGCRLVKRAQNSSVDTSIKSWTQDEFVPARGFYLWANSNDGYADSIQADSATTQTIANDNGIALRFGKENEGKIIDSVSWGACENIFIESEVFAANPQANQSIMRKNFIDTDNNKNDFEIQTASSPQNSKTNSSLPVCGNAILEDGEECDDGNKIDSDGCDNICKKVGVNNDNDSSDHANDNEPVYSDIIEDMYKLGDIVINEIVSDPTDNDSEWIELYNTQNRDINLGTCLIEEGGGAKTDLQGVIFGNGSGKLIVIENIKGNLNNQGDRIFLYCKNILIDQLSYGDWEDGNKNDNAPFASDPFSLARKMNGYNTYNNNNDFAVTKTPTKNASNIISKIEDDSEYISDGYKYDYSDKIIITEILVNPEGDDAEGEFIEIFNQDDRPVNLLGWRLGNGSKKKYEFAKDSIIPPGEYMVIKRNESKLALNNSSGQVSLYQPLKETFYKSVSYSKAREGQSYNYICVNEGEKCSWINSEKITPGKSNDIQSDNHVPSADFSFPENILVGQPVKFDSTDTIDEDNDNLTFSWDFGDKSSSVLPNPEHTYFKTGNYKVALKVKDKKEESKIVKTIYINDAYSIKALGEEYAEPNLIINEFMPDPEESDDEEWIEILNIGSSAVDLLNWRIDDSDDGSKSYVFSKSIIIESKEYYVLDRSESGIALNNNKDVVRLYDRGNGLVDSVSYAKAITGSSYALDNGKWQWTIAPTPGEKNIISLPEQTEAKSKSKSKKTKKSASYGYKEVGLEKINNIDIGENVVVKGTVVVAPGVFGAQYFYIQGSPGIQIYSYYKKFPRLKIGDVITVRGELSKSNLEKRIKIKEANDISVLEHKNSPDPKVITCETVGEEYLNQLVSISGEVTDKKSSLVYLDDGTNEATLYIKKLTGISTANIKVGDQLKVVGLVSYNKDSLVILPRSMDDIEFKKNAGGQVLGETASNTEWLVEKRDKKLELFTYLLIIAGGIIVILAGLLIKLNMKKQR